VHHRLALTAVLLALSGCVVPPPPGPYAYPGYAPPGYPPPGYPPPGYPAPYGQPDFAYPGYAYNDGSPTFFADGVNWPLVFFGGGWGYWDGYHRWHGAPPAVWHNLEMRHPGGVGYHPAGGGPVGRPVSVGGAPGGPRGSGPPGGAHPVAAAPRPTGGHPPSGHREEDH
jgi:hypothetical protein